MEVIIQDTDIETVKRVMLDKVLFDTSMPDSDRVLRDKGTWEPDPNNIWEFVEVVHDNDVVGIIRYQPISVVAIDCHIHLLPKYWGKKISDYAAYAFEKYIENNTQYHKLQVQCPKSCINSIKFVARHGFEIEGVLSGATYWDGEVEDLVILGKFIRRI